MSDQDRKLEDVQEKESISSLEIEGEASIGSEEPGSLLYRAQLGGDVELRILRAEQRGIGRMQVIERNSGQVQQDDPVRIWVGWEEGRDMDDPMSQMIGVGPLEDGEAPMTYFSWPVPQTLAQRWLERETQQQGERQPMRVPLDAPRPQGAEGWTQDPSPQLAGLTPEERAQRPWWERGVYPTRQEFHQLAVSVAGGEAAGQRWLETPQGEWRDRTPWELYEQGEGWLAVGEMLWIAGA